MTVVAFRCLMFPITSHSLYIKNLTASCRFECFEMVR